MKLLLDNLPLSLHDQRETLARCREAMNRVTPLRAGYLFGSHVRGAARPDSDVDLCIVAEGAAQQLQTAQAFGRAMRTVWPRPSFTLVPITPQRLEQKKAIGDFFLARGLGKEFSLPRKTDSTNPADWLWIAESDLEGVRLNATHEVAYYGCQGKLAEVFEKRR